ncbi:hypothetical protein KKC_15564, partial [Listeria fleischmannii subsp. coloradonensis]
RIVLFCVSFEFFYKLREDFLLFFIYVKYFKKMKRRRQTAEMEGIKRI